MKNTLFFLRAEYFSNFVSNQHTIQPILLLPINENYHM